MADHRTYSSYRPGAAAFEGNIINMDPPRHDQWRGLVSQVFTPRAIAQLEPRIRAIAEELLGAGPSRTELELIDEFAYPLPVTVIAEMLGVPATDRARFRKWTDQMHGITDVNMASEQTRQEVAQLMRQFHDYLLEHVQLRRAQPREDLLAGLVTAELDGQRLSDEEIVGFATILLIAGHITTTSLLGNALLCLDEAERHGGQRSRRAQESDRCWRGRCTGCAVSGRAASARGAPSLARRIRRVCGHDVCRSRPRI